MSILDLGCNRGETLNFFRIFYPFQKITGYEPNKVLYNLLSQNYTDIELKNLAVGSLTGKSIFFDLGDNMEGGGITKFSKEYLQGKVLDNRKVVDQYEIDVVSINDIILENTTVIKIDIEGFEYEVLGSVEPKLLDRINLLVVEFHFDDNIVPFEHKDLRFILKKLNNCGFKGITYDTKNWVFYRNVFHYLRFKYSKILARMLKISNF